MRHSKPTRGGGRDARFGAAGPSQRQLRAGELVRHALAEILREEDIQDPALAGVSVTVTEVRTSPDLRHATCFVEPLGGANAAEVVKGLNRASKFLRGRLGKLIDLKFTPDLHFLHDESFDAAAHINALFASPAVARDLNSSLADDGEGDTGGMGGARDSAKDRAPPSGLSTDPLPGFAGTPPSDDRGEQ
jgi:ribosome-binding factor A